MKNQNEIREKLLEDLEETYIRATEKGNYSAALKAKELIGKEMGFFEGGKKGAKITSLKEMDLKTLSDQDLEQLISTLQEVISQMETELEK
ncbi:hypothetical protein Bealeia1_00521 [Candidatus Bealeia paramacronuclearis]|uniref:Uncharacterized protein n=1 Tax=Candidatus Bealeia paramacronuclearis TaxID=1921001 RepID=A0ABZ2C4H5_9PROT|nr:hypothetical protein [Candidatus Bealeia paramacronuclearis]